MLERRAFHQSPQLRLLLTSCFRVDSQPHHKATPAFPLFLFIHSPRVTTTSRRRSDSRSKHNRKRNLFSGEVEIEEAIVIDLSLLCEVLRIHRNPSLLLPHFLYPFFLLRFPIFFFLFFQNLSTLATTAVLNWLRLQ